MIKLRIYFDSKKESGNIFFVLALCKKRLDAKSYGVLQNKVLKSKSYADALKNIRKKIDLVDISGEL